MGEGGLEGQTGDTKARGQEKRHQKKALGIKPLLFFKDINKIHTLQLADILKFSFNLYISHLIFPLEIYLLKKLGLVTVEM